MIDPTDCAIGTVGSREDGKGCAFCGTEFAKEGGNFFKTGNRSEIADTRCQGVFAEQKGQQPKARHKPHIFPDYSERSQP